MMNKKKGYTLIELMIVISIISILAIVSIPRFGQLINKSRESNAKNSLGALRSAVSVYFGDTDGKYPTNLFTGLTNNNKYLPPIRGLSSLGRYKIPAISYVNNPGHSSDLWENASSPDAVDMLFSSAEGSLKPLYYDSEQGTSIIYCTHLDTKQSPWSTY